MTDDAPGLFGKLPSRGDFVARRLDAACRDVLDHWLQACLSTSRRQLGDAWLNAYLNAPVWRFVLGPGRCGAGGSADAERGLQAVPWFDTMEALALTALDSETDLVALDEAVRAAGLPAREEGGTETDHGAALFWLPAGMATPVTLHTQGLPRPQQFGSLLTQYWPGGGWRPAAKQSLDGITLMVPEADVQVAAAGRTHAGTRRAMNQDALLMRADHKLWAVADGVVGHDSGEVASRTVVEHLEQMLPPLSLDDLLDDAEALLAEANTALRNRAASISDDAIVASTVAVLAMHDGRAGVLWSGDSRVYRLRAGALNCLTRDHVENARCHTRSAPKPRSPRSAPPM